MLTPKQRDALLQARHHDPFALLGMHTDAQGRLWVRALLPGAQQVQVLEVATGKRVATLVMQEALADVATGAQTPEAPTDTATPLFEGLIPRRRKHFDYRLRVRWGSCLEGVYDDAYRHGPLIGDDELYYLGEGTHLRPFEVLGAHPVTLGDGAHAVAGVRFAVWAPNASRVSVVGDFNSWDGRRHAMRSRGSSGVWEIFIPRLLPGAAYKYEIVGPDGGVLPL